MANVENLQRTKTNKQTNKQTYSRVGEGYNRHFSKEDKYAANKHEKMLIITGH